MTVTASVVVCAYTLERWDDTVRAVESARAQTHLPARVLLVVDHNEMLLQRARHTWRELPAVTVVPNSAKRGLSGARNTAISLCDTDIVAFLDDDAAARRDWLARLVAPFADSAVVATGGTAEPLWPAARPRLLPPELFWIVGCTYLGQPSVRSDVRNVMGCSMAFRRDVFATVGGFAEDVGRIGAVPLGCEETELCIRARQHDPSARIVFEPAAIVDHRVSQPRTTWAYLTRRSYAEGLSKAAISRLVGASDALSSERAYTRSVLPRGVARELRRGRPAGALAILASLGCAAFGYLRGRWTGVTVPAGSAPIPSAVRVAV